MLLFACLIVKMLCELFLYALKVVVEWTAAIVWPNLRKFLFRADHDISSHVWMFSGFWFFAMPSLICSKFQSRTCCLALIQVSQDWKYHGNSEKLHFWFNIYLRHGRAQEFSALEKGSRHRDLYQSDFEGEPVSMLVLKSDWYRSRCLDPFPKAENSRTRPGLR